MKLLRIVPVLLLAACAAQGDDALDGDLSLREGVVTIKASFPTPEDVVATVSPGEPFFFQGRYYYAAVGDAAPTMGAFAPANVDDIPFVQSGDVLRVVYAGNPTLSRIAGTNANGSLRAIAHPNNGFQPQLTRIPWSAWGPHAATVAGCAAAVEEEREACMDATLGEMDYCSPAAADELGGCASGQDPAVESQLGAVPRDPAEFLCLLPEHYSVSSAGLEVDFEDPYGNTFEDCLFFGTISQQSGEMGCETIYDGTIICDDLSWGPGEFTGDATIG